MTAAINAGKRKDYATTLAILHKILEVDPNNGVVYANIGNALNALDRLEEAEAALKKAIALVPQNPRAYQALAQVLLKQNRVEEAVAAHSRALQVAPNDPEVHGSLSHVLLLAGDYERGLAEYEWRWKCQTFETPRRSFTQPQWTGQDIASKRI